jgi:hypothetical protein
VLGGLIERSIKAGKPEAHRAGWETELECPALPMALAYLWMAYKRMRRRKGGNGFGPQPIEGQDVESYERRFRFRFLPFENEIIDTLDDLYMVAQSKDDDAPTVTEDES